MGQAAGKCQSSVAKSHDFSRKKDCDVCSTWAIFVMGGSNAFPLQYVPAALKYAEFAIFNSPTNPTRKRGIGVSLAYASGWCLTPSPPCFEGGEGWGEGGFSDT